MTFNFQRKKSTESDFQDLMTPKYNGKENIIPGAVHVFFRNIEFLKTKRMSITSKFTNIRFFSSPV